MAAAVALEDFAPDMVAGHSLGEFSALVAAGALEYEDALRLVAARANAMNEACKAAKAAGAKMALPLPVGGAFHSPLMEPARAELAKAIDSTPFREPVCPIYQNVDAQPHTDPSEIKENLIAQLTSPVRWSQSVINMSQAGATDFVELEPGNVLTNLIGRILA